MNRHFLSRATPVEERNSLTTEIIESCRRQRVTLMLERERVRLCHDLRHVKTRIQMGRIIRKELEKEIDEVVLPLVESVRSS